MAPHHRLPTVGIALLLLGLAHGQAQTPAPSPLLRMRGMIADSEKTQVMILGTFHFREVKSRFRPEMVEAVLHLLEQFRPDAIAVEKLPGSRIHELELRSAATEVHADLLSNFAADQLDLGHRAQELLGEDAIRATKTVAAYRTWDTRPDSLVQRTLHSLAAYELPGALLAWSGVPADDRSRAVLPIELATRLDSLLHRVNEIQQLAIPLARRLGLATITGVDDFEDEVTWEALGDSIDAMVEKAPQLRDVPNARAYRDADAIRDSALASGDLTSYYRFLNSQRYQDDDVAAQWEVFLRTHLPDRSDRSRLGLWENRNLKIAARIRALTCAFPGRRVLVIYGSAHKPFLDTYLSTCSDIRIVQPSEILGR